MARYFDRIKKAREAVKMGFGFSHTDPIPTMKGKYILELTDSRTGKVLEHIEKENLVTLDGGVLIAMLLASGATPTPPAIRGLTMLAVGTGATGPILNPDAPDNRQRHLNAEIARKPFTSTVFRTAAGAVSAVPTNVVDFTTSFGEGEAVGPLNEMGLVRTISMNPVVLNPVVSVFPTYDPSLDLTVCDILVNVSNFNLISKPNTSILTITWRISC
ncbi:MAG: hypothetical protein A3J97_07705 [Spirochaetes bacterium RIFOXYC1_FULL_54_7]|nr:MAG: hypothetical protein A3J97_07705 [Spirochaetes bacterium RIFOXYC1_FULL_54_7]